MRLEQCSDVMGIESRREIVLVRLYINTFHSYAQQPADIHACNQSGQYMRLRRHVRLDTWDSSTGDSSLRNRLCQLFTARESSTPRDSIQYCTAMRQVVSRVGVAT